MVRTWEDPSSEERTTRLKEQKFPDQKQWTVDRELGFAYACRDLLLARTEPCHCTRCGCSEFVEIPQGTEFSLPDGSGTVTLKLVAHAQVGVLPTYYRPYYTPNGYKMLPEDVPPAPPGANCPAHFEWENILYLLVFLVTIPVWVPLVLLGLVAFGIWCAWDYLRRQWSAKATGH